MLSKDYSDHGNPNYSPNLISQRSASQNQRLPSENTINFHIRELNQNQGQGYSRFNYPNQIPHKGNLMHGNPHYHPHNNIHNFDMSGGMYPQQNRFGNHLYYKQEYSSPYGTEQYNYPTRASQNSHYQNPYMSHKQGNHLQKMERSRYMMAPNNSTKGRGIYLEPKEKNLESKRNEGFRNQDNQMINHDNLFVKETKSKRNYPKSREFKPSRNWRYKEKRLSRERKSVDNDLVNVINKYKYGQRRNKF